MFPQRPGILPPSPCTRLVDVCGQGPGQRSISRFESLLTAEGLGVSLQEEASVFCRLTVKILEARSLPRADLCE